jgi:hypothetical protein
LKQFQRKSFVIPENEEIVEVSGASLLQDHAPNRLIRDTSSEDYRQRRETSVCFSQLLSHSNSFTFQNNI